MGLEAVHHEVMGRSTGPDIILIKKCQSQWNDIDQLKYELPQEYPHSLDGTVRGNIIHFAETKIQVSNLKPILFWLYLPASSWK